MQTQIRPAPSPTQMHAKDPVRPTPVSPIVAPIAEAGKAPAPNDRELVKVFKALSDRTRQQILQLLEERQRNVGEIVGEFELSQPTISRHLSVLKEADLVRDRRQGQNVIYRLNQQTLSASMQQFFGRFSSCQQAMR